MLVLCYGIQKSGSTLTFEMVKAALASAGFAQDFIRNDLGRPKGNFINTTRDNIVSMIEEIGPDRRIAAKSHSGFAKHLSAWLEGLMREGKLRVIASYRDPRDACLSLVDAAAKSRLIGRYNFAEVATLDDAVDFIEARIGAFEKWAALEGTLLLDYETVAFAPDTALDAIERTLGIVSDRQAVLRHAFEEADTLKNKAQPARHRDELSPADNARLTERFQGFLTRYVRPSGP